MLSVFSPESQRLVSSHAFIEVSLSCRWGMRLICVDVGLKLRL